MNRLRGKVAIVTGAASSKGLGFAIAAALAREGAKTLLTDVNEAAVAARARELNDAGERAASSAHDVTVEDDWARAIDVAVTQFGSLDILVNNAGVSRPTPVDETSIDLWQRVIDVNLKGTFLGCKHAMKRMLQQSTGGSLVNIASVAALFGFPGSAAYASSKGGIRSLSRVVALEGARQGIRCNSVYPGVIMTDLLLTIREQAPERTNKLVESVPLARMGDPIDIANAVVFLASDESKYVTGAELVVDGGLTAQ